MKKVIFMTLVAIAIPAGSLFAQEQQNPLAKDLTDLAEKLKKNAAELTKKAKAKLQEMNLEQLQALQAHFPEWMNRASEGAAAIRKQARDAARNLTASIAQQLDAAADSLTTLANKVETVVMPAIGAAITEKYEAAKTEKQKSEGEISPSSSTPMLISSSPDVSSSASADYQQQQ